MNLRSLRKFRSSLGPVEQAQVVASTAVVVALVTIVTVRLTSGHTLEWLLFGSVLTVGVFGFIIVFFTLKYGRQLEEQRQELLALNAVAEAVNRAVDIPFLFQNVLQEIKRLVDVEYAWIYKVEGSKLVPVATRGTEELETTIIDPALRTTDEGTAWIRSPRIVKKPASGRLRKMQPWPYGSIEAWASIPITMKDQFFGVIVAASRIRDVFSNKQVDLIVSFANQIGVAMENAALFDRLRKSEERYMDLFEHSPDMYHIVNTEGMIVSCNQTEASRLGYRKDELVGQPVLKVYPPDYHDEARRLLRRIFERSEEVKGLEEQMVRSNGELIDVSVNTSIIYDEAGKPILMRSVARDITEKKKLEAKIVHAQRIDSIGNLAGGVAHDFNNILTSILGSTAIMMRKMKHDDKWYRFVEIIETAAKRGAGLTRQLLTFARKGTVQFRPIMVNDIIEETLHLFERSVDKTISIRKALTQEICLISGDDGQVQQALLNLLINARDAMPEGGTISIQSSKVNFDSQSSVTAGETRSGEYVAVMIGDTGVGMDKRTQQHIFEPFFTTKDQGKGTGLGLSVVYGVVNSHNGFITVESEPGRGSQFWLYFPLLAGTETARRSAKPARLSRGGENILVVDDEPDVSEVIGGMLQSLGYRVEIVNSGKKAITRYKKKPFDLVVLDMNMPTMGGKETFFKLREIDPQVHVVISTGYSNRTVETSPLRDMVDGFLQKPYQLEELSKTLRVVFEKAQTYEHT